MLTSGASASPRDTACSAERPSRRSITQLSSPMTMATTALGSPAGRSSSLNRLRRFMKVVVAIESTSPFVEGPIICVSENEFFSRRGV